MAEVIEITLVSDVIIYINENNIDPYASVESDPTVPSWVKAITENDIDNWNNPPSASGLQCDDLPDCPVIISILEDVSDVEEAIDEINSDVADLTEQVAANTSDISTLQSNLTNEINTRNSADNLLTTLINNVAGNLANEAIARESQDDTINARITAEIAAILDGVDTPGNTLQKLYNLILASVHEAYVANIAARNAYNVPSLPFSIFVTDDGDGNWAKYQATTTGVGATYVKISDPDLLNAAMSASAIKAAYESNPNTNAFTNALLSKLNGIATAATANDTDANLRDRTTHTGTQDAATITGTKTNTFISDFAATVLATVLTGLSTATNAVITASDSVLGALGKLQKQITDLTSTVSGKEESSNKDASGGYAGLTLFKLNMRNVANTFTSYFTNSNTGQRTYTLPDLDGTIALTSQIPTVPTKAHYALHFGSPEFSPADATIYYFGNPTNGVITTTADRRRVYFPQGGTLKKIYISLIVRSAIGSTENVTFNVKINNGSPIAISSTVVMNVNTLIPVSITSLTSAVNAGDYFEIEMSCPTWATNPTNVTVSGHALIEHALT